MKAIEDLSAGFGAADCYFTVAKPVGDQVEELAATCSVQLPKLIKKDSDGVIAVHAKSLAALLKLAKQPPVAPAPNPTVPPAPVPVPPAPKQPVGAAKKPTPTPPTLDTDPGSATSDTNAVI